MQYHDAVGGVHPFAGALIYVQGSAACGPSSVSLPPVLAGDGSGYTLNVSSDDLLTMKATVVSKGGVSITPPTSATSAVSGSVADANGNYITAGVSGTTTTFTDTLGKTALTVTGAGTPASPLVFSVTNPQGTTSAYTVNFSTYTIRTNFGCGVSEYGSNGTSTANLVSSVVLPDNTQYKFGYENTAGVAGAVTGRLSWVTLPAGGAGFNFLYYAAGGSGNKINCADGSASQLQRQTPDGTWSYSHATAGSNPATWTNTMTDPAGNETDLSLLATANPPTLYGTVGVLYGYETLRSIYQGSSAAGTLLQKVNTCYGPTTSCSSTAVALPVNALTKSLIWQPNGLQTKKDFVYDNYGNNTSLAEYGYATNTAPTTVLRRTTTTYNSSLGAILNRPSDIAISDGTTTLAHTQMAYDESTLAITGGTPQHLALTAGTPRGNVTTVKKLVAGTTYLTSNLTYFDTGNVNTVTDPNAAVTTNTFGACGNSFLTTASLPASLSRSYAWDCNGGIQTSVTDENGKTWVTAFTDANFWRPTSQTDPASAVTTYAYPATLGSPGTTTPYVESTMNFNGTVSTQDVRTTLDALGRASVTQVKQSPSSTTYDSVQTSYDSVGRPYKSTVPYSAAAGVGSGSPGTTVTYDGLNRPTQVTDGGGGWVKYTYLSGSPMVAYDTVNVEIGPKGTGDANTKQRQIQTDALGRVVAVCEVTSLAKGHGYCGPGLSTGLLTSYSYDALDNLKTVIQNSQPGNTGVETRSYNNYDGLSRLGSEANPETGGLANSYTYDTDLTCGTSFGDLVKKVDPVGNTICYRYDALHRLTAVTYSGGYAPATPSKTFVYDAATVNGVAMANAKGHLAEAYTGSSSSKVTDIGFSYSSRGEVTDAYESTPHSGGYYHTGSTYWENGLVKTLTTNLAGVPAISYAPDSEGRVNAASASAGQSPVTSTNYDTAGHVIGVTYGSADSDNFGFDPNTGRPTSYTATVNGNKLNAIITNNTNGTIQGLNVVDQFFASNSQTCSSSYDDLGRLITYNCGTVWSAAYSYDAFGNMMKAGSTSFMPTYNLSNQFQLIPSGHPSYDNNGNLLNDSFHTYAWDAEGHPVTIDMGSFVYDALGRRVEFGSGSSFTQYFYAAFDPHYNLGNAVAFSGGIRIPVPGGGQATANSGGVYGYRHPNWQGSQMVSSTTTRTVAADSSFSPYGERYSINGYSGFFAGMLMQYPFFTDGYQADARLFEDYAGRWVSPDPAGLGAVDVTNPQTLNRYVYVGDDPLNHLDPSGLGPDNGQSVVICITQLVYAWNSGIVVTPDCYTVSGGNLIASPSSPYGPGNAPIINASTGGTGAASDSFANRFQCAAAGSDALSLNAGLTKVFGRFGYNPSSFFAGALAGSTTATISNLITGPGRVTSGLQLAVNSPLKWNAVQTLQNAVGSIPTKGLGTVQLAADSSGRYFGVAESGATLAATGAFKSVSKAIGLVSLIGLAWDVGTYVGSLYSCSRKD